MTDLSVCVFAREKVIALPQRTEGVNFASS